jgi:hypothetical protein
MEDTARDEKAPSVKYILRFCRRTALNESIPTRSMTAFVLIISKEDKKLMAENAGSTNKERNKCKPRCILQPENAVIINMTSEVTQA